MPGSTANYAWSTPVAGDLVSTGPTVIGGALVDADADLKAEETARIAADALLTPLTDARLTDARTPLAHRGTHGLGGSDALTTADLGGGTANSSTFLRGDRTWAAAGGGAMELIARVVLGATAASIDFTSIPATYESLVIDFFGRGDVAAAAVECRARFNGDASSSYEHLATSSGGNAATASTGARFCVVPGATGTANKPGVARLVLPGYARTVFHKMFTSHGGDGRTAPQTDLTTGTWASTAAINQITLYPFSGNLIAGTVAALYGIRGT